MNSIQSVSNIWTRSFLLGSFDYDVKYFNNGGNHNDYRIESIRIPKERKLLLDEIGIKNFFDDDSEIYDPCSLCVKTVVKIKYHNFRQVSGICRHLVSPEHKLTNSIDEIKNALREIEKKSIENQLKKRGLL